MSGCGRGPNIALSHLESGMSDGSSNSQDRPRYIALLTSDAEADALLDALRPLLEAPCAVLILPPDALTLELPGLSLCSTTSPPH
jgi:hypothetical protein